jgi:hypothetical protein
MKGFPVLASLALCVTLAFGCEGRPKGPRPQVIPDTALSKKTMTEVSASYQKDVEPLLKRACFDCHSDQTVFPWYHHLPLVAQYLDNHVEEARHHIDFSKGFPFTGRAPIIFRVRGIGRTVQNGSMPLWDYKLMHPASHLTDAEKKVITDWADASFDALSKTAKPYTPVAMMPPKP